MDKTLLTTLIHKYNLVTQEEWNADPMYWRAQMVYDVPNLVHTIVSQMRELERLEKDTKLVETQYHTLNQNLVTKLTECQQQLTKCQKELKDYRELIETILENVTRLDNTFSLRDAVPLMVATLAIHSPEIKTKRTKQRVIANG